MKKFSFFSKTICSLIIIALFITLTSSVFASSTIPTNSLGRLRVKVTNLQEPAIGEEPDFYYNARTYNQFGYSFEYLEMIAWVEVDIPYDECLALYDSLDPSEEPDENSQERYQELLQTAKVRFNEDSEMIPSEIYDLEDGERYLEEYVPNKTYIAAFVGLPSCLAVPGYPEVFYSSEEPITTASLPGAITRSLKAPSTTKLSLDSGYDLDLTVNNKSSNVRGAFVEQQNLFMMLAFYSTELPKQNYKATVNWIDAEGKIPDSFVLKLMNGSTVVKEQVITKDNAVDDDTWEYDFGEYPIVDENGNEITYTLAYSESKDGDLKFFTSDQNGFVINNTYVAPIISSKIKMRSIADREANNVKYRIDYNASIKKYSGNADVVITTTLPFAIDEAKSDLDGGKYDTKTRSIVWTHTIEDIDKMYDYSTTKNIDVYATAVLPYSIEAKSVGEISLSDAEGYSESVDAIDNIEAGTGNPKTGDIILQKYLSFGLIGIAAILMVVSIKRKYSTRKKNVQF